MIYRRPYLAMNGNVQMRSYRLWFCFRCLPALILGATVVLLLTISPARAIVPEYGADDSAQPVLTPNGVQAGQLLFRESAQGLYTPGLIQGGKVHFEITGMIATVTLEQSFRNTSNNWVEGIYAFPLPEHAAVRSMEMIIGNRRIVGKIKEKSLAKKIYREARASGKKASLVEQRRANLFTNQVANIGPHEEVIVRLEYVQPLDYQRGQFALRFPMTITPRYFPDTHKASSIFTVDSDGEAQISNYMGWALPLGGHDGPPINRMEITAKLDAGMPLANIKANYHEIVLSRSKGQYDISLANGYSEMDRDFVLQWKPVTGSEPTAAVFTQKVGDSHYGLLMLVPPELAVNSGEGVIPREIIFVIDTSGSMGGVSIEQARQALKMALSRLRPQDSFNIIEFNSRYRQLFKAAVPANRHYVQRATEFVRLLSAGGGTEMLPALRAAFSANDVKGKDSGQQRLQQVVFITDGAIGNEAELFSEIEQTAGERRLFTVGIGSAPNSWFMRKAAQFGRGTHTYIGDVSEVTEKMSTLFEQISSPMATNLDVLWPGKVEAYPQRVPDLYSGQPVLVAFKYEGRQPYGDIEVAGQLMGQQWSRRIQMSNTSTTEGSSSSSGVASIWARRKIASLLDQKLMGADEAQVRTSVLDVALMHNLMSPYTSFVAVEEEISRPPKSRLGTKALPNTQPKGQSPQYVGYPATATTGPANIFLGGLFLFLALMTHVMRQPEVDDDSSTDA